MGSWAQGRVHRHQVGKPAFEAGDDEIVCIGAGGEELSARRNELFKPLLLACEVLARLRRSVPAVRLAVVLLLCVSTAAAAQFGRQFGRFGPRGYPPRFAKADSFGHGFNFCRGMYTSGRREAGGQGWSTDYPDAELNFSIRLSELTKTRVAFDATGTPEFVTVRLTDPELFQCPYLHMEETIKGIRAHTLRGSISYHVITTTTGRDIKLYDYKATRFEHGESIRLSVTPIYGSVFTVANASGTYRERVAYMYSTLIFSPSFFL